MGVKYQFEAIPWRYNGPNGWIFVSLPLNYSQEIRTHFKNDEEGWGRMKATAQIGNTEWKTAIWFDTKANTYLLPLKSEVRKAEKINLENTILVSIWI